MENDLQRKRNRTLLLCIHCRKRKVKCDRRMPCLSCIKHKTLDECDYSEVVVAPTPNAAFADKINIFRMFDTSQEEKEKRNNKEKSIPLLLWSDSYQRYQATPATSYSSAGEQNPSKPSATGVISELQLLKLKVIQLEAALVNDRGYQGPSEETINQRGSDKRPRNDISQKDAFVKHRMHTPQLPPLDMPSGTFLAADTPRLDSDSDNPTYVGINPYDEKDPNEVLNLYDGYNPIQTNQNRQMNYGPYSWLSIMKKDKALVILFDYLRKLGQKQLRTTLPLLPKDATSSRPTGEDESHEEEFRQKALARDGHYDQAPLTEKEGSINEMKIRMNQNAMALGLTFFEGEIDQNIHLMEKIKLLLPNKTTLWILINRFFLYIYPFIPLIDEVWFRTEIKRLLGPEVYREEKFHTIRAEKRLDLAIFGILFIMLRLSYLSTFSNNKADNDRALASSDDSPLAETKYILTHPIDMDVIKLAQICLDQFDLYRRTNLTVLQCAVFMRIYHLFSPEEGDGSDGGNSHVFNGMCLQMAFSMGLNREPSKFDSQADGKVNNLGRKLWFFLKLMDMNQSSHYGFPLAVDDNYNDVLVPYYRPGNANVMDVNMEKALCETLQGANEINLQLREILRLTLSMKHKMKMKDLTEMVSRFECQLSTRFGALSNFSDGKNKPDEFPFKKVLACKAYMNFKSFLVTLFYHFFLNYENEGKHDLAFFYLRKYMAISCGEFLTEYLLLIGNNHANFDPKSTTPDLILSPSIEMLIHKNNQMNFSILVRINHTIASMKKDLEVHSRNLLTSFEYKLRFARLSKLSKMIEKFCKFGTSCLSRLSNRYYYAWRISKAHNYTLESMSNPGFQDHLKRTDPSFLVLSTEQINELLSIADSTLWRIKSSFKLDVLANDQATPDAPNGKMFAQEFGNNKRSQEEVLLLFKRARTEQNGLEMPSDNNNLAKGANFNISPSSALSFEVDDFHRDNKEIDMVWHQLTSINNRMIAESRNELPTDHAQNTFNEWMPLYLTSVEPFTPHSSRLDNIEDAYDFLRSFLN